MPSMCTKPDDTAMTADFSTPKVLAIESLAGVVIEEVSGHSTDFGQ